MLAPNHRPLTPISFLERSARVFPSKTAVVDGENRYTYREFHDRARALAAGLQDIGIKCGDRVAFLMFNGEPLLTAHFGVPMSGGVLVPVNTRLSRRELTYILSHTEASALVATASLLAGLGDFQTECPELLVITYEELLVRGATRQMKSELENEDDLICLNYTSGTTGYLKGVMYTHRGAYLNALGNAVEIELTSATRYLWTLPMFHCNGWCYTWAVTAVAGTHVCLEKPAPADVF